MARITEYFSTFSYILPRFLKPAVSMIVKSFPLYWNFVSIVSLVVPSILDTISLSSFKIALTIDDLPDLPINTEDESEETDLFTSMYKEDE